MYNPLPPTGTAHSAIYPTPYGTTTKSNKASSYKRSSGNINKDSSKGTKGNKAGSNSNIDSDGVNNNNEKNCNSKRPTASTTPSASTLDNSEKSSDQSGQQQSNKKLKKPSSAAVSTFSKNKKSQSGSNLTGDASVDRQKTIDTIQNLNAAAGGKNDKAAALAAAILRGVTMRPSGKWQAQLYYAGKSRYIGVFDTREKAALAYEIAREKLKSGSAGGLGGTDSSNNSSSRHHSATAVLSSTVTTTTPSAVKSTSAIKSTNEKTDDSKDKNHNNRVSCTENLVNLARKAAFAGVNETFTVSSDSVTGGSSGGAMTTLSNN